MKRACEVPIGTTATPSDWRAARGAGCVASAPQCAGPTHATRPVPRNRVSRFSEPVLTPPRIRPLALTLALSARDQLRVCALSVVAYVVDDPLKVISALARDQPRIVGENGRRDRAHWLFGFELA